jgi:hypothetical protein
MVVLHVGLMLAASGSLIWLLVELRVAPRRVRAVQRERAAQLRLEFSRRDRQ